MIPPAIPADETSRLRILLACGLLDAPPHPHFERLVDLACRSLDLPMAGIGFIDRDHLRFKARRNLRSASVPRSESFCAHVVGAGEALEVPDATADPRFADHPLVTGASGVRSYLGAPIRAREGSILGVLCVLDRRPRRFTASERQTVHDLAALAEALVEHGRETRDHRLDSLVLAEKARQLEHVPAPLARIDASDALGALNGASEQVLGLQRGSVVALSEAGLHPDDLELARNAVREVRRTPGAVREVLLRHQRNKAGWATMAWTISSFDGEVFASARDVTRELLGAAQTAAAMAAARESELRYRNLLNSLDGVVWEMPVGGDRFTFVSDRAEALTGHPHTAWLEAGFWVDHLFAEDREQTVQACLDHVARNEDHVLEYRFQRADGGTMWLRDLVRVLPELEPPVLRGILIDITAQRLAEQRLAEERQRLSLVVAAAAEAILTVSGGGTILDANAQAGALLGHPPALLLGRSVREFMADLDVLGQRESAEGASETIGRRSDGSTFVAEVSIGHFTMDGRPQAVLFVRDVSENRAAEQAVLETQERIHQAVSQELHDNVGQLLTAIKLKCDLLVGSAPPGRYAEECRRLADVAYQAQRAVKGLTRLLHPAEVLGGDAVTALEALVRDTARLLEIEGRFIDDLGGLGTGLLPEQELQLYRVAQQALANACEHGGARTVELRLRHRAGVWSLSVWNDGAPHSGGPAGLGTSLMRYRARTFGASVSTRGGGEAGFEVLCQWSRTAASRRSSVPPAPEPLAAALLPGWVRD